MSRLLAGKTVVVSGASSGIGRACAIECARAGAQLVLMGRDEQRLEETQGLLGEGDHRIVRADLEDVEGLEERLKTALRGCRIDGFISCAGVRQIVPLRSSTPDVFRHALAVNTLGALDLVRMLTSRSLMAPEGGTIVLVSSMATRSGGPGLGAYCASKAALEGAMKALVPELASRKIRINCLLPGHIRGTGMWTEMEGLTPEHVGRLKDRYPLGLGEPSDVARAALFLVSEQSRWITGASLLVDGGYSLRP